jgi:hypothetical protein
VARIIATVAVVLVGVALASPMPLPAVAGTGEPPVHCDETSGTRPRRCVGPLVDESGGGGDTVTIVVSVVVGLAVAGVAYVLLRRQLSRGART